MRNTVTCNKNVEYREQKNICVLISTTGVYPEKVGETHNGHFQTNDTILLDASTAKFQLRQSK